MKKYERAQTGSNTKKKLLIINQSQFGYHIDTYEYCKHLKEAFYIHYICWDYDKRKLSTHNTVVKYITRKGNKLFRNLRYYLEVAEYIKENRPEIILIKYFVGCSILKILFFNKNIILDIRTGSTSKELLNRFIYNMILKLESLLFHKIIIISEGLRAQFRINSKYSHIVPLGANIYDFNKDFDNLNLLYVGSFDSRNIHDTIIGFDKFYSEYKNYINMKYTIVGYGMDNEINKIIETLNTIKNNTAIQFVGHISYDELVNFYASHNIGVSYVPQTSYFNFQPPTKTYEYILAGMPVIATKTAENQKVVNRDNGVLINDNSEEFYKGLIELYRRKDSFTSEKIRNTCHSFTWEKIVHDNLLKYLKQF